MLEARNLVKEYLTPRGPLRILSGVSFSLDRGESASIMGPSGSSKSTLLYILGALEPPTSGQYTVDGVDPFGLNEPELARFRNSQIGFLFQDHCLLPQCSVLENALAPALVSGSAGKLEERARELLASVGLEDRLHHRPGELSGGEKQRAALARALILSPQILLCDEPTGNLDRDSAASVASLLFDLHRRQNAVLIVVTHSPELAARCAKRYGVDKDTKTLCPL